MTETIFQQLQALSTHLALRREAILQSLRAAADSDPEQTTVASLTRAQFHDHLPEVLEAFERHLCERFRAPGDTEKKSEEVKHGLHRWQQGYRLRELLHEWGHLHVCLFDELESYAATHPELSPEALRIAHRALITLVNEAVSESTGQYARLQQEEAAGHVRDLQRALTEASEMELRRGKLLHQAVHDLGGNFQALSSAASLLSFSDLADDERVEYADLLRRGTGALRSMLGELMGLARLEAGQERREVAPFDAAHLLAELSAVTQPLAGERSLYLRAEGAASLSVDGDSAKVRRIAQNLVLNALKYTEAGGVTLSWGEEGAISWWMKIQDTGPGIMAGPGAPIIEGLKEATNSAREADQKTAASTGEAPSVVPAPASGDQRRAPRQQAGEGVGLSIVKRLCELLDGSLELASSPETGTTFRVVLPRQYPTASRPAASSGTT